MEDCVTTKQVEECLHKTWSNITSADSLHYPSNNPAWGQCAVSALVAQDFLGGTLLRFDISTLDDPLVAAMRSHYVNVLDNGYMIDFTQSQFQNQEEYRELCSFEKGEVRAREYLLSNPQTKERYEVLRINVAKELSGNNPLFMNEVYRECLALALQSNCKKGKYGCVVEYENGFVAKTYNKMLDPLSDWCQNECIRSRIPSRTESMIGACGHAEEFALQEIIINRKLEPRYCHLYVAGFRSSGLAYIKPEPDFTCIRCAVQLYMHDVHVYVPCKDDWSHLTAKEALQSAKKFALQEKKLANYQSS